MLPVIAPTPAAPKWHAGLADRRIYIKRLKEKANGETKVVCRPLDLLYVLLERGETEWLAFCVTWPKGRLTFSDSRETQTGTAGSTGLWGTRTASKAGKRRTLTPTAWVAEVSRLIGTEQAEQIVRSLSRSIPPF